MIEDTASLKISPFQSLELMKVIYTQIYVNRWATLAMAQQSCMVYNATFNNISVLLWRSVLLVEESGENQRPVTSRTHNFSGDRHRLHKGSCKSNYHTITTTTAPFHIGDLICNIYMYVQYESKCEWIVPCTVLYKVYVFYVDRTIQYGCHGRTRFFTDPYDLDLHCISL